jgi:predicted ATPase
MKKAPHHSDYLKSNSQDDADDYPCDEKHDHQFSTRTTSRDDDDDDTLLDDETLEGRSVNSGYQQFPQLNDNSISVSEHSVSSSRGPFRQDSSRGSSIDESSKRHHHRRKKDHGSRLRQLRRMSSKSNPNRGLIKLDFSHLPLYGRFQEKLALVNSLGRAALPKARGEVVLLFGKSGTGKSYLVSESLSDRKDQNHIYGRGKFEQAELSNRPYAAIVQLFSHVVDCILRRQEDENEEDYATSVSDALGDEAFRIVALIPNLVELIGDREPGENDHQRTSDLTSFMRLLNLLRYMLRAICSHSRPVVLFFDDLHYADADSLSIFRYLANDPEITNLLVIGSYEDDGETAMEKVSELLEEIDQVKKTLIRLENLTKGAVNHLISDLMETHPENTEKLSKTVYKRTKGNTFFVIQLMELIQELGFLQFNVETKLWEWDLKVIRTATKTFEKGQYASNKVKYAVSGRVSHLPQVAKLVLSTAACLGSTFDVEILAWLLKDKKLNQEKDDESVGSTRSLESATAFMSAMMSSFRGIDDTGNAESIQDVLHSLLKIGMVRRISKTEYQFAHDKIEQSCYELLSDDAARVKKHYKCGFYLKRLLDKRVVEDDWIFFTMVDQLNMSSTRITDSEERLELSSLNLRAGFKARDRSAFHSACKYADKGLSYLQKWSKWSVHRGHTMKLMNLLAEMALACGDYQTVERATERTIANGTNWEELIPPYLLQIKMLAQKGEADEGFRTALDVLRQLGESFPAKPSLVNMMLSVANFKSAIKGKSDDNLLSLPNMEDDIGLFTMRVLALAAKLASLDVKNEAYIPLIRCRMLHLSLKHGVCDETILAYTGYGTIVASSLNDTAEAYRFGNLGLQLQQLLNIQKYHAIVAVEFYGHTHHLKEPIQHSIVPLQQSFRTGMRCGTIEDALAAASVHVSHYMCSGRPLGPLSDIFSEYLILMNEYKPLLYLEMLPFGQLVKNLMGRAPHADVLNGDIMDMEATMTKIKETGNFAAFRSVLMCKIELCYWLSDFKGAHEAFQAMNQIFPPDTGLFSARRLLFYEALSYTGLARTSPDNSQAYLRNAKACCRKMQKYAEQGALDCLGLLEIMEADILALSDKATPEEVTSAFDRAISSATDSRAHNNMGLANELAGRYHEGIKNEATALQYFKHAHQCYSEWQAFELGSRLLIRCPALAMDTSLSSLGAVDHDFDMDQAASYNPVLPEKKDCMKPSL